MDQNKKTNEVFYYGSESLYKQVTSLMQDVRASIRGHG